MKTQLYINKYRIESTRISGWDYNDPGKYFITICTKHHQHWFGHIDGAKMHLSGIGKIADQFWRDIPRRFDHVRLDEYVIMPNHIHGIIVIMVRGRSVACNGSTGQKNKNTCDRVKSSHRMSAMSPKPGSLPTVIRSFKSAVTRQVRLETNPKFQWQSRYYDHIVRNHSDLERIRRYIRNNPNNWNTK